MGVTECDVVVVGAGISGMTAAYRLKTKHPELDVQVLEAKDRVGGRTQTVPLKTAEGTDHWDVGGQWVARSQPHIMSLVEELELKVYPQYLKGTKFLQLGSHKILTYKSDIPSLSILALIDLQLFMMKIDRLRKKVDAEDPWKCEKAAEWDAITMETFIRKSCRTKEAQETVEAAGRCIFGAEASQMSLLFYLTYTSAADGLKNLTEGTDYAAQEYKIQGGAQQLTQRLLVKVGETNVHLEEPVASIVQKDDHVTVKTTKGDNYRCKRVICATPPAALGKIRFEPGLPTDKQHIIDKTVQCGYVKVLITYKQAFWRDRGLSGEVVSNGGPQLTTSCDTGPVCMMFDATSGYGSPALVAFIGGYQANQWSKLTPEERRKGVLEQISTFFGDEARNFVDFVEKDWSKEPYQDGGCICALGTGAMRFFKDGMRKPFKRVHFAGTETASQWCGYFSGAVQAGYRAATEVLTDLCPHVITQDDQDICRVKIVRPPVSSWNPFVLLAVGVAVSAVVVGVAKGVGML